MTKRTLAEISAEFGKLHTQKNTAENKMKKLRQEFFDNISFEEYELARIVIYCPRDPERHVAVNYPGWRIKSKQQLKAEWKVIIEEDPAWKKFEYINPEDGKVYQRQLTAAAPEVNLEELRAGNASLYKRVTYQPPRELKSLDELDEKDIEKLLEYLGERKLTLKMAAPRKAKPEELETLD